MPFRLVLAPSVEPITLVQAKAYLRLKTADQDARVTECIRAGRGAVELYTERAIGLQTWELTTPADAAATDGGLELPRPPLRAIVSAVFTAPGLAPVTIPPATYAADRVSAPGRLVWAADAYAPARAAITLAPASVVVTWLAGYAHPDEIAPPTILTPPPLLEAVYRLMATCFLFRAEGDVLGAGEALAIAPYAARELMDPFRLGSLV
jgi:uncharacterized phiE125 gp8 family phage protein